MKVEERQGEHMSQKPNEPDRNLDALRGDHSIYEFAEGIFGQEQAGWLVTIETSLGLIQIDTGDNASTSLDLIRSRTQDPFYAIIFSHGHQRYNLSCREWVLNSINGHGHVPRVIGHENVPRRQKRYLETNGLQNNLLERQFRYPIGSLKGRVFPFFPPTETFSRELTISTPGRTLHIMHTPSETDDALSVWIPEEKILYAGPSVIPFLPNIGSPQRPLRDAVRWANTLDELAKFPSEILIREFGPPIKGRANIDQVLTTTARALRWCHEQVVNLMNDGHNIQEIVNMITPDPEIFDYPWLAEGYTAIEHIFQDIYRSQFGWWTDLNPTSLHPAHPADVAREIRSAITDPAAVLAHARQLAADNQVKLALHVIDLLALGAGNDEFTRDARILKAELCKRAATEVTKSYVSQSLLLNGAAEMERLNESGN